LRKHGIIVANFTAEIVQHVRQHNLGIVFGAEEEIASSGDSGCEIEEKIQTHLETCLKSVWIVHVKKPAIRFIAGTATSGFLRKLPSLQTTFCPAFVCRYRSHSILVDNHPPTSVFTKPASSAIFIRLSEPR
jgi:hypothetical protein